MLTMRLTQNLEQRQTLIQKLGLESEFLNSCLVRTEVRLSRGGFQRGLALLRGIVDESRFRSVLDWLLALYVPALDPEIDRYYAGEGKRFLEAHSWQAIAEADRLLDEELVRLADLHKEVWTLGLYARDDEAQEIVDAYLEMLARPRFARIFAVAA